MATVDRATPTNKGLWECPTCTATYTSPLSAAMCSEDDVAEDARTREWFTKHNDRHIEQ